MTCTSKQVKCILFIANMNFYYNVLLLLNKIASYSIKCRFEGLTSDFYNDKYKKYLGTDGKQCLQ